jgi:hypothetical protein
VPARGVASPKTVIPVDKERVCTKKSSLALTLRMALSILPTRALD